MVVEFNGFSKGVIGKKLPADTVLNNMKKTDLIGLLRLAQHNYETLYYFYNNAVHINTEDLRKLEKPIDTGFRAGRVVCPKCNHTVKPGLPIYTGLAEFYCVKCGQKLRR